MSDQQSTLRCKQNQKKSEKRARRQGVNWQGTVPTTAAEDVSIRLEICHEQRPSAQPRSLAKIFYEHNLVALGVVDQLICRVLSYKHPHSSRPDAFLIT